MDSPLPSASVSSCSQEVGVSYTQLQEGVNTQSHVPIISINTQSLDNCGDNNNNTINEDIDNNINEENEEDDNLEKVNFYSEISRETLCGSPFPPQKSTLDNSSTYVNEETLSEGINVEMETTQLNAENLLKMKKNMANGNLALHSGLLTDNLIFYKKIPREKREASILTVFPETDDEASDSLMKLDYGQPLIFPYHQTKIKDSLTATPFCSVDSICGSSAAPNILNRRNLDRFAYQLHFGNSTLKPEILVSNFNRELDKTSGIVTNDGATSLWVELGSGDGGEELKSQCDTVGICEEARKLILLENLGDFSSYQSPLKDISETRKEQFTSEECLLQCDEFVETYLAKKTEHEGTHGRMTEAPFSEIYPEICQSPEGGLMSSEFSLKERGEDSVEKESTQERSVHRPVQFLKKKVSEEKGKRGMERGNITSEIASLYHSLPFQLQDIKKQLRLGESKTMELQTILKENFAKIETQIIKLEEKWSVLLTSELNVLKHKMENDMHKLRENYTGQIVAALQQINDRIEQVDQFSRDVLKQHHILQQQQQQQQQVNRVFQQEARFLPPPEGIPDGEKIHLIVDIHFSSEHRELLLPISLNATVGMCKRELLRRLRQQGLIDDSICYSNVLLFWGTLTLFEEDVLMDVLTPISQHICGVDNAVRLTLHTTQFKAPFNSSRTPVKMCTDTLVSAQAPAPHLIEVSAALTTTTGNNNNNNNIINMDDSRSATTVMRVLSQSQQTPTSTSIPIIEEEKKKFKHDDFGVLCVEAANEVIQNESLYRRLIWELERMGRSELFKDEKVRRTILIKDILNRHRLSLLDRVAYSPVEAHRHLARSVLGKLENALLPGVTLEEMLLANNMAQSVLQTITSTCEENDRVDMLQEAIRVEQDRKQRTVEEIKELSTKITHHLRIPVNLLKRAEFVTQNAERAVILAPSMTLKELDDVHNMLMDFCASVSSQN